MSATRQALIGVLVGITTTILIWNWVPGHPNLAGRITWTCDHSRRDMNPACWTFRRVPGAILLLAFGLLVPGCSQRGETLMDASRFSSAPAELKEKWKAAADDASKKNYLGAATNLMDIYAKAQQLTAEQNDALNQAWQRLGNQAFDAANKGDKTATQAVLKMRESRIGDQSGRP